MTIKQGWKQTRLRSIARRLAVAIGRTKYWILVGFIIVAAMPSTILPAFGRWLAYQDVLNQGVMTQDATPQDAMTRPVVAIVVNDSPAVFAAAATFASKDSDRELWLYTPKPRRAERMGAIATPAIRYRDELIHRGIEASQIRIHPTDATSAHRWIVAIDAAIENADMGTAEIQNAEIQNAEIQNADDGNAAAARRDQPIIVFCDSLEGRYWRNVIDQSLPPASADDFKIRSPEVAVTSPRAWFRSRHGAKLMLAAWLKYSFVKVVGESESIPNHRYDELVLGDG